MNPQTQKDPAQITFEDLVILTNVSQRMGIGSDSEYRCSVHDANVADAQAMRECSELRNVFGLKPAEQVAA